MTKVELAVSMLSELFVMGREILAMFGDETVQLSADQIRDEKARIFSQARIDEAIERRALQRAQAEAESCAQKNNS